MIVDSLCPMDPIEAGEIYRMETYRDLEFRAKKLKMRDAPEVREMLKRMRKLTVELAEIAEKEKGNLEKERQGAKRVVAVENGGGDAKKEWWKDGEYDETKADEANDLGSKCLKMAKERKNGTDAQRREDYEHAFEAYTEAIRLEPKKAVYFANRAFCALKLERYAIAAEDSDNALKLNPKYEKALTRGAKAHMKLNNETKAMEMYEFILRHIDQTHAEATKGREEAKALLKSKTEREKKQREATRKGELREPLFDEAAFLEVNAEQNAENLIASEEMLRQILAHSSSTSPYENNARFEYVENCIKCQRVLFALDECESKLPRDSIDRLYLLAECKWRINDVSGALRCLEPSSPEHECDEELLKHSRKCQTLANRLRELETTLESIESLADQEEYQLCVEKCDYILEQVSMGRQPTRFRANILVVRASNLVEIVKCSNEADSSGRSSSSSSEDDDLSSSDSDSEASPTVLKEREFEYSSRNAGEKEQEKLDRSRLAKTALKSAKEALLLHANNVEAHVISHEIYLLANKRLKTFESIRLAQMLSPEDPIIARKVQKLARVVSQVNRKAPGKKKGRYGSDVDLNDDDDDDDEFSSKTPQLYKILDCRQTARPKQIAKAYKTQAMKWHPDKQHSKDEDAKLEAETRFKQIAFAFSVLSDKKKRAEYDEDNTKYDQML